MLKKHKNCARCIWYQEVNGFCSMGFPIEQSENKIWKELHGDPNNEMGSNHRPKFVCPKPYNAKKLINVLNWVSQNGGMSWFQNKIIIPQIENDK